MYFSTNNTITFRRKGVFLMNIKHAQYMLTVMQEGSITAAAKKLLISQPSLSQTVKAVEDELGLPIFDRRAKRLTLTYAGQRYVESMREIMTAERNFLSEIAEMKNDHRAKPVNRANRSV